MKLPRGWVEATIGELGHWQGGGTPSKANPAFWVDGHIPWVSPKDMKRRVVDTAEDRITADAIAGSAANLIPSGAVLLVVRSGILKHTLPVAETVTPVAINQDLKALSPHEGVLGSFVRYAFEALGQDLLHECAKAGTTVDSIDFERLKARSLALPPAAEQRRIVAKLDTLTARLARARAELDRVPALTERLRKAILAQAISGGLSFSASLAWTHEQCTAIGRRRSKYIAMRRGSRLRSNIDSGLASLGGPRAGWLDCRLADVVDLRVGHAFKSVEFTKCGGVPLLRGANIAPGKLDWSDRVCLSRSRASSYDKYLLQEGDIVIAMDRPIISTGLKIARLGAQDSGALLVQRVASPQTSEWITPQYLMIVLQSHLFIEQVRDHATGSDLPHISANDVLMTPCPLPPIDLQHKLARAVKTTFARADRLEAEAARARALIDRLEAAILAKAFRGELVPQDPNDEPASVLLERIRARRAEAARPKRGRRAPAVIARSPTGDEAIQR